jgi:hypothetical protein
VSGPQFLSDADLARYFIQATGQPRRGADPMDMEPRIAAWLKRSDMAHRRAWPIALEVAKIADAPAPLPTPEAAGKATAEHGNQTLTDEQIAALSFEDYSKLRAQFGIGQNNGAGVARPIVRPLRVVRTAFRATSNWSAWAESSARASPAVAAFRWCPRPCWSATMNCRARRYLPIFAASPA